MEDKDLERKINAAREAIGESDLHDDHKEALHEALDQAAKTANGSQEKLHDMSVALCKGTLRNVRTDITFKPRVSEAVQPLLDKLLTDMTAAVAKLLNEHTMSCPNKASIDALKEEIEDRFSQSNAQPTTWKDLAKIALSNPWFYFAVSVIAFSPNILGIIDKVKQ
jgi:hypothetical protein